MNDNDEEYEEVYNQYFGGSETGEYEFYVCLGMSISFVVLNWIYY